MALLGMFGKKEEAPRLKDADYAYAVARIRANEAKLLSKQDIDGLLASGSCEKCIARLADKGWGSRNGAAVSESAMLKSEYARTWELIEELAPDISVFRFITVKNDYHNLKAALKARLAVTGWEHMRLTPCEVSSEDMSKAVSDKQFGLLPGDMPKAAEEAYEALITWVDGQMCEMILDRAALEASYAEAKKQGGLAEGLALNELFASDIKVAYRGAAMKKNAASVKKALAECPGLDTGRLAMCAAEGTGAVAEYLADTDRDAAETLGKSLREFEILMSARQDKLLEEHKYDTLGSAPLISYIWRREREIADVRLILAGLRNGVDPETVRAML